MATTGESRFSEDRRNPALGPALISKRPAAVSGQRYSGHRPPRASRPGARVTDPWDGLALGPLRPEKCPRVSPRPPRKPARGRGPRVRARYFVRSPLPRRPTRAGAGPRARPTGALRNPSGGCAVAPGHLPLTGGPPDPDRPGGPRGEAGACAASTTGLDRPRRDPQSRAAKPSAAIP